MPTFPKILLFNLFFLSLISSSLNSKYPINKNISNSSTGKIISIDIESLDEYLNYINNYDYVISLFHMDWCGHCKKFLPIFDKASSYNIINNKWKFLKIACSNHGEICNYLHLDRYPTIKVYIKSNELKIEPIRELDSLLEFLLKLSDNPIKEISDKEIKNFYNKYGTFSPLVYYRTENTEFISCINMLAKKDFLNMFYFGIIKLEKLDNNKNEKIIFDYDNLPVEFNWKRDCDEVNQFLSKNIYPLVSKVNSQFVKQLNKNPKILAMLIIHYNNEKMKKFVGENLKKISYKNRDIIFGYLDYNTDKELANYFKIKLNDENEIKIVIYDFTTSMYYIHIKNFNIDQQKENEITEEIKDLTLDVSKLSFTSGSKFTDILKKWGINDPEPVKLIIIMVGVIFGFLALMVCVIICTKDNEENKENKNKIYKEVGQIKKKVE